MRDVRLHAGPPSGHPMAGGRRTRTVATSRIYPADLHTMQHTDAADHRRRIRRRDVTRMEMGRPERDRTARRLLRVAYRPSLAGDCTARTVRLSLRSARDRPRPRWRATVMEVRSDPPKRPMTTKMITETIVDTARIRPVTEFATDAAHSPISGSTSTCATWSMTCTET